MKTIKNLLTSSILLTAAFALACCAGQKNSQNADDDEGYDYPDDLHAIESMLVEEHDADWYAEQAERWREQTEEHSDDDWAWLNYFRALNYQYVFTPGYDYTERDSIMRSVVEEMADAVLDTYAFYYCAYNYPTKEGEKGFDDEEPSFYAEKAIKLLPENGGIKDYDQWLAYLALHDKQHRMETFAKKYYEQDIYSKDALKHAMNRLNCMEDNAIYVGNGDMDIFPFLLIQNGTGKHKDKVVVCYSFLNVPEYIQLIYDRLGIGQAPEIDMDAVYSMEDYDNQLQNIIDDMANRSGRKLYLAKTMGSQYTALWDNNGTSYDIGLLYEVSNDVPIDIVQEQRRHYENDIDLSYLEKPLDEDAWVSDSRMSVSNSMNFRELAYYYRDNDSEKFKKLVKTLRKAYERGSVDDEFKQYYDDYFDQLEQE